MRLSEAMRLGSMMRPQAFGRYRDMDGNSCAMGAALDAIGKLNDLCCISRSTPIREIHAIASRWWPWAFAETLACPVCAATRSDGGSIIAHINNVHRWTREQIADWVQTLEEKEAERLASTRTDDAVARGAEMSTVLAARA